MPSCNTCPGCIYDTGGPAATYPETCQVTDPHLCLNLGNLPQITDWDHGLFLLEILLGNLDRTSLHFHVQ